MTEWHEASLADLCAAINDGNWIETKDQGGEDYRLVQVSNIGVGEFRETGNFRYVTQETFDRLRCREVRPGMVLIARMPDPVGRAWFVKSLDHRAITSVDVAVVEPDPAVLDGRFCAYLLNSPAHLAETAAVAGGTTRLRVTRKQLEARRLLAPEVGTQRRISAVLGVLDDLIENNRRRANILEEVARASYREWFVYFRYPGHEAVTLVDSSLGPIPAAWAVEPVTAFASSDRHAVTAGPFGSKLGRKDYVATGVPVIRGSNLRVGGGFHDRGFVYVSETKAAELGSCVAQRGDMVVTQRGTLGQVGLIPIDSTHERYVLSQSQMKVTIEAGRGSPEFVYRQFSSPETTERFVAQAITAGVPHVNLTLLRNFPLLAPPPALQKAFGNAVRPLDRQARTLVLQADCLVALRDALLPKLVSGQIDVSSLDLDALVESSVA